MQLDMMILALQQPGKYILPDIRCVERLVLAMKDEHTLISSILPDSVKDILSACEDYNHIEFARAWWEYNEKTHFMRNGDTAKLVRGLLKKMGEETGESILDQEHEMYLLYQGCEDD